MKKATTYLAARAVLLALLLFGPATAALGQQAFVLMEVIEDLDCNGVRDGSDLPIANLRVFADANGNGRYDGGEPSVQTDGGGFGFLQLNLIAAARQRFPIVVEQPGGRVPLSPSTRVHEVELGPDELVDLFQSFARSARIIGEKFDDPNGDGRKNPGEGNIEGVPFLLDGTSCAGAAITREATSADDGIFVFDDLPPGSFEITEEVPPNFVQTAPPEGRFQIDLDAGETLAGINFGNRENITPPPANLDFGDAPDPTYATLLANDGARHTIVAAVRLGDRLDGDADGQPHEFALGDDLDEGDDEDGVVFRSPVQRGSAARLTVTASVEGFLDAWADFDGDGTFEPAEQIFGSTPLSAGANELSFGVPDAEIAARLYIRFRFSTTGGLGPDGPAPDGEVEDYVLGAILGFKFKDDNRSGGRDPQSAADPTRPERLLPGWTFYLLSDALDVSPLVVTDADGAFRFTGLPPGEYRLHEEVQDGWTLVNIPTGLGLEIGEVLRDVGVANFCPFITLSGLKWRDDDGDGQRGADEPGWDWPIILEGTNIWGEPVRREITTEQWKGEFAFEFVEPGTYTLSEEHREGWTPTFPEGGHYELEVACGDEFEDLDFGNEPAGLYALRPSPLLLRKDEAGPLTIHLTKPAPPGGLTFRLAIGDAGIASLSSATITIPEGEEQGSVMVTGLVPGDTEVRISAAPDGWVPQSQGDDRSPVRIGPDLSITADGIDPAVTDLENLEYKIKATVANAPERVNADPFQVKIEAENPKTGDVELLGVVDVPGLAGGASTTVEVDYLPTIPRTLIRVFVDSKNVLDEKDEGNNKATKELFINLLEEVTAFADGDSDAEVFGRFISHSDLEHLENTFTAEVLDGVDIEKVVFELHGEVVEDASSAGGWTADFSMGALPEGRHPMTIYAIGPREMMSEPVVKFAEVEEFPEWIKASLDAGFIGLGGRIELTPTHLFVGIAFTLGASKGGGPFSYLAEINNAVEFIPKEAIDAETSLELELGIPLDDDQGWAGGGTLTLTQNVLGQEVGNTEVEVQVFLDKNNNLEIIRVRYGKEVLLYSWEIRRSFPITSGVNGVLGGGFDILGRFSIEVVAGEEKETKTVEFVRTPQGDVSSLLPGLGIRANLIVGLEILFGLVSGELILSPRINLDVGATYTTASGVRPFASGEFLIEWTLIGALFFGLLEEEIASGEFGPWQLFEAGGKTAAPSGPFVTTDAVALPSILPLPSLAADAEGRMMALWLDKETPDGPPQLFFALKSGIDDGFGAPLRLADRATYKADPAVAFGPQGTAHAVWVENTQPARFADTNPTIGEVLRYQNIVHAVWDGARWSTPRTVMPEAAGEERGDGIPAVLVSPDGSRGLVLWTRNVRPDPLDRAGLEIFAAPLDGGAPVAVTDNATCDLMVRGAFLDDDTALALWLRDEDGDAETVDDFEIQYAVWEAGTWRPAAPLTRNDRQENHLSVARLADGRGIAAWVEVAEQPNGTLHYALLTSVYDAAADAWSPPETVHESVHFIETPLVQVDARTIATVTWRGYHNEHINGDLLLALKDFRRPSATWTTPRALTDDALADWMTTAAIDAGGNQYVLSLKSETQETAGKVAYQPNFHSGLHLVARGIQDDLGLSETLFDDLNLGNYLIAPDLHVDSTSIALTETDVRAGQPTTLRLSVVNRGGIASPAAVARLFDGDPQAGAVPLGPDLALPPLEPDARHEATFAYTLSGRDTLVVQIDPDVTIEEQTKANNTATTILRLRPDLAGESVSVTFDDLAAPGTTGRVAATVRNLGQVAARSVPVHFFAAETDSLKDAVRFAEASIATLAPGATATVTTVYPVERAGRHTVFAVIDPDAAVAELSETNNVAHTAFAVLPDLVVESVSVEHGLVRAAIRNAGGVAAEGVAGYLYAGNPLAGGVAVDSVVVATLAPGARDTLRFGYAPPTGLADLYVWLDPHETLAEVSRANNRQGTRAAISGTADLAAELSVAGPYPLAGPEYPLLVRIHNRGTRGASAFTYQLFQGAAVGQEDSLVVTRTLAVVNPGETAIDTVVVMLLGAGRNGFLLRVDTDGDVEESDETNNQAGLAVATSRDDGAELPTTYFMDAAYPNPFNPQTTLRYGLPEASRVRIEVFNVLGQRLATLADADQAAGIHQIAWTPGSLASGVYFLRIEARSLSGRPARFTQTRKAVLLR